MREGQGRHGGRGVGPLGGLVAAALFAVSLAACEGVALPLPHGTASAPEAASETASPTADEPNPEVPQPGAVPEPETAALPPEPVIDDDPARVMGLGAAQLTELLGRPELTRREPPAEIWQYRGRDCVFDVFLYEDAGLRRVTYLEARDDSAQPVAARDCLNQILRARLARPLG
jgi:hypothetical protein